jgi:hypothetical protein
MPKKMKSDLPGCIRSELFKLRLEEVLNELGTMSDESAESIAWQRWGRKQSNQSLANAIYIVANACCRPKTCMHCKLIEAAWRLHKL